MEKLIFIILHSKSDNAEIMVNPFAIESIRCNVVNLHEHYYEVRESYEEIKQAIKNVMEVSEGLKQPQVRQQNDRI